MMPTHLDLDDVAAGNPKAEQELAELRARLDDTEQDRTQLEEMVGDMSLDIKALRGRLAEYERNTIRRDESVPDWADFWTKDSYGPFWYSADNHPHSAPAPDLRPGEAGPFTLPIVNVE